ncbi:hypothetical protein V3C40_01275 [Janthinobacterium sp. LS2A]|uniref:hypothetical protein n=1 Tax=Janthinobacterium sp. LS2A TaxID=3118590 RepID=UPI002F943A8D
MKKLSSVLILSLALSACATMEVRETSRTTQRIGHAPQLNVISKVTAGEALLSTFQYTSKSGYQVYDGRAMSIGGGRVAVIQGDFLYRADVEGKPAYCTERGVFNMLLPGMTKNACFADRDNDGLLDQVMVASDLSWWHEDITPGIKFGQGIETAPIDRSINSQLLYQGYSNKTLRIAYREYLGDLARPSFSQDLSYDITSFPTEITFRKIKMQIRNADNHGLEYQIIGGY